MIIVEDYFISKNPLKGTANFSSLEVAKGFAGTNGSVQPVAGFKIFESAEEFDRLFEKHPQASPFAALGIFPNRLTDKGEEVLLRLIEEKGVAGLKLLLDKPLDDLDLTTRLYNFLKGHKFEKLLHIAEVATKTNLMKYGRLNDRSMKKNIEEIEDLLGSHGLSFGMFVIEDI